MYVQQIVKRYLALSMLAIASVSYAKTDTKISCPTISTIQLSAQKIDRAELRNCHDHSWVYDTFTTGPAFYESNLGWYIASAHIAAKSEQEAIRLGQESLKKLTYQVDTYAVDMPFALLCTYGPEGVTAFVPR